MTAPLDSDTIYSMKTTTVYPKSIKSPLVPSYQVLKKGSNNKKLGFKITSNKWEGKNLYSLTLTERDTCPESCHHWEDCYGNNMPFAHRFSTLGLVQAVEEQIETLVKKHPKGIVIRLHVLGDFYSFDYVRFWEDMLLKFPTLCVFGYTAREHDSVIGAYIQFLNIEYRERFVIRFSRSNETKRIGLWYAAEETFTGPAFTCPEQTGKLDSCASCGLCWTAPKTVRFLSH